MMMNKRDRRMFELMLIVVAIGMTYLTYRMGTYKVVVLNLFFLPIVLSGYYLGRTSAGVLALFCALAVTVMTTMDPSGFSAFKTPVMVGLALTVWSCILGLTAILVGTLCDERAARIHELHEAYVGVVEVFFKYLQSANPKIKTKSIRIAEISQMVAEEMNLSRVQIDDIRVGALLYDLGNVEITTKLINKAIDSLESKPEPNDKHTFLGVDLVHALGSVLHGAVPLLITPDNSVHDVYSTDDEVDDTEMPVGARIIRIVRKYDTLAYDSSNKIKRPHNEAVEELMQDNREDLDKDVVEALGRVGQQINAASSKTNRQRSDDPYALQRWK